MLRESLKDLLRNLRLETKFYTRLFPLSVCLLIALYHVPFRSEFLFHWIGIVCLFSGFQILWMRVIERTGW
ncbi:MAG: hypothetical protein VX768_10930 [Planctomycetota bacterium]|nr:hypothetical protein [Planctomycetota bacterium]